MTAPRLYLIRGVSGSGKSTFAERLREAGVVDRVIENDQFRTRGGRYVFRADDTERVCAECLRATAAALLAGQRVAVPNAFIRRWEMQPYLDLAKRGGVPVLVMVMDNQFGNVHGTPPDKLDWMKRSFEL